jgi:hypothetical protein
MRVEPRNFGQFLANFQKLCGTQKQRNNAAIFCFFKLVHSQFALFGEFIAKSNLVYETMTT